LLDFTKTVDATTRVRTLNRARVLLQNQSG